MIPSTSVKTTWRLLSGARTVMATVAFPSVAAVITATTGTPAPCGVWKVPPYSCPVPRRNPTEGARIWSSGVVSSWRSGLSLLVGKFLGS